MPGVGTNPRVNFVGLSVATVVVFALLGCQGTKTSQPAPPEPPPPTPTKQLSSIAVTPGNATLAAGSVQQYRATGTFSDGSSSDVTQTASWSSSQPAVATIDTTGLATGVAAGSTTISASSGSVSGSASLSVTAPAPPPPPPPPGSADLTIDFGSRSGEQVTVVPGIFGAQYVERLPDQQTRSMISQAGFGSARTYANIPAVYATQTPDWTKIDPTIQALRAAGLHPIIELAFTPTWLAGTTSACNEPLQYNPPADVNKWGQLAASFVAHFDAAFPGWVRDYEIWNEPDTHQLCSSDQMNTYMAIYAAAAPQMRTQAQADGVQIRIGGPASSGAAASWVSALTTNSATAPYVDFVSYHLYLNGPPAIQAGMTWDGAGGTPSLYSMTMDPNSGEQARFLQVAAALRNAVTPLGPKTPIYFDEYNDDWWFQPDCCRNSPTYSPMWNALVVAQVLNAIYSGAPTAPENMTYYAATAPPFCLVGVLNEAMDCTRPSSFSTAYAYPQLQTYKMIAAPAYLGLGAGGSMASSITLASPATNAGVSATAFYTSNSDSVLIVNPKATPFPGFSVLAKNPGFTSATAKLFTLNTDNPQISTASLPLVTANGGLQVQFDIPPYSVMAVTITGQ